MAVTGSVQGPDTLGALSDPQAPLLPSSAAGPRRPRMGTPQAGAPPRAPNPGVPAGSLSYRSRIGHGPSRSFPAPAAQTPSSRAVPQHLPRRAASRPAPPSRPSPRAVHAGTRTRPPPHSAPCGREEPAPPVGSRLRLATPAAAPRVAGSLALPGSPNAEDGDPEPLRRAGERETERSTCRASCKWGGDSLFTEPRTERGCGDWLLPEADPRRG